MNDPTNERDYEFSFKITCKGSLQDNKIFSYVLEEMKNDFKEVVQRELVDFGSIGIVEV